MRFFFISLVSFTIFFVAFFYLNSSFKEFITNQLAAVIGINIQGVYDYQTNKGINRELSLGDSGREVKLVQQALHATLTDFPEKNISGYYGSKTSSAVSAYQKNNGLAVTGKVDNPTRNSLNEMYFKELCPDGSGNIPNDEILVKVNRSTSLEKDYIPQNLINVTNLVKTTSVVCLKQEVVPFLKRMFDDASQKNIQLAVTSGFRKPEIQGLIYKIWVRVLGEKGKEGVAEPLHSEHRLGTTIDLTGKTNNFVSADEKFHGTPEELWLRENAYKYGFVLSYPKDKTSITGYIYEPWHYRYVGLEAAKVIFDKKISVEEYFDSVSQNF
jgi:zinc D-Ala-D-Ala carboxypeptidase